MDEARSRVRLPLKRARLPRRDIKTTFNRPFDGSTHRAEKVEPLALISKLLAALSEEEISYCHWKSNWKIDNWLTGDGDLDLLVRREDISRFVALVSRLGFKQALVPAKHELPGIVNFYGYDVRSQRFVHIHAHYQLVLGHDLTKNYRLPVESSLLDAAIAHGPIVIASPEFELALFVIRMTLKYSPIEATARGLMGKLERHNRVIADEIEYLRARIDIVKFQQVMREHFPMVSKRIFDDCLNALNTDAATSDRLSAAIGLKNELTPQSRKSRLIDTLLRANGWTTAIVRRVSRRRPVRKRLESGGCLIALVGGDGSGKTTAVDDLNKWLGKKFETRRVHFGKPPKSILTLAVIGAIQVRRWLEKKRYVSAGREAEAKFDPVHPTTDFLQRLRWLCTARDRYSLYKKVRRFSSNGGLAICDRIPLDKLQLMDGPRIAKSISGGRPTSKEKVLIKREHFYYGQIMQPDLLIVLRVDAATATARKTTEPAEHVRPRAEELWRINWLGMGARVVDAGRPLPDVLMDIRNIVWSSI